MTRNPATLLMVSVLLLAFGFAAGFGVGRRQAVEEGRTRTMSGSSGARQAEPFPAPSTGIETGAAERDQELLRRRIADLETALRTVHEESGKGPPPASLEEVARLAFEDLLAMEKGDDQHPDLLRSLIDRLARVDERTAKHFIARMRGAPDGKGSDDERKVAMQLVLLSGGPDAAEFIRRTLADPETDADTRERLLRELGPGRNSSFFSIRRLPVHDALAASALQMAQSPDVRERIAGANLLGGVRTPASRGELLRLLGDADSDARETAARSLGRVGDPTSRKILETYAAQTHDEGLRKAATAAILELDRAPR